MSEENKELSPDELMAQQFGEMNESDEETQTSESGVGENSDEQIDPDTLMAQQFAEQSYGDDDRSPSEDSKLSMLLDIPLEITVEIGTTQMLIEEVLKLNPNSIIELDRYINEPVDLKVNGRVIAKGELYTVKNNFGIRITHIITPEDRLKILER